MVLILRKLAFLAACSLAVAWTPSPPSRQESGANHPRHAWVTLGYIMDGLKKAKAQSFVYELYALASSVRKYSEYPLVLITDLSTFDNSSEMKMGMERLGVHLHDMQYLKLPEFFNHAHGTWPGAWQKLQMFNMTDWDRLVWLDTDGILTRNMDHLFHKKGTWSQGDDWLCQGYPLGVCSGLVSFEPNEEVFKGILALSETLPTTYLGGDQVLIEKYYRSIGKPVQTLPFHDAAFGECSNITGDIPGFIHKPVGFTDCLRSLMLFGSSHSHSNYSFNLCMKDTQGQHWRRILCESEMPESLSFSRFCQHQV